MTSSFVGSGWKAGVRSLDRTVRGIVMLSVLAGLIGSPLVRAQFWQQDAAFKPVLESPAIPLEHAITGVVRQPDGKLLTAGYIERVNGQARANPAAPMRFNPNGSLDATFQASDSTHKLFLQPSGKIVTGEGFRLNANGGRDLTFQLAANILRIAGVDSTGRLYAVRNDGRLVRTTPDGVLDPQFQSQLIPFSTADIAAFADGSVVIPILLPGPFNSTLTIVRLRNDGSEDPSFARYVDSIQSQDFLGLTALPDGRALLYGKTAAQFGVAMRFVRLGLDGRPDYTYVSPGHGTNTPRFEDNLTLAGVLFDLLRDANAAADTRVRAALSPSPNAASLDVGADGTLWLANPTGFAPDVLHRYTRSSATGLTINPTPTIVYDFGGTELELLLGQSRLLVAPTPGGLFPLTYQWRKNGVAIPGATKEQFQLTSHSASDAGSYTVAISNAHGSVISKPIVVSVDATPAPITLRTPLQNTSVSVGSMLLWWIRATANPYPSFAWTRNGVPVNIVTSGSGREAAASVQIMDVQPAHAGIYEANVSSGNSAKRMRAILGVLSDEKTAGAASEVGPDIVHPNKNIYDQVLLTGASAAITADAEQVTRISFVDLTHDIVQVELSGAGTVALVLENAGAPAPPAHYNQPNVLYVRGHPGIVVAGADETTNLSVFSVGRANAVNQALFRSNVDYDGLADVAFIAISSTNGRFGGLRAGNAHFYAGKGLTGVYAPGIAFAGPVFVGDVDAFDDATPALVLRSVQEELRITGGDLLQTNGKPVRVGELVPQTFTAGSTSHGDVLPAQPNGATFAPDNSP